MESIIYYSFMAQVFYYNCRHCGKPLSVELRGEGICQKCIMLLEETEKIKQLSVNHVETPKNVVKVERVEAPAPVEIPAVIEEVPVPIQPVKVTKKVIVGSSTWGCKCKNPTFIEDRYGKFCNSCGKPKIEKG